MPTIALPQSLSNSHIHMVGIKGTGMVALAELLTAGGARVTGSDTHEHFYTDEILRSLGLRWAEGFSADNIPPETDVVVYSAAYDPSTHVELTAAREQGLPIIAYAQALGMLSGSTRSVAIAGVHGKTTTAALCASLVQRCRLPGAVLAGSALANAGGRSTLVQGSSFLVAETCEYRRNFLHFRPELLVVTSIEADHLDYFRDRADVLDAFEEFALRLPPSGELIYCADDRGSAELAHRISMRRPDVTCTPYGTRAEGAGAVELDEGSAGEVRFSVGGRPFILHVPGAHNVLNAAAALLVADRLRGWIREEPWPGRAADVAVDDAAFAAAATDAIEGFLGTRRRSEIVDDVGGVLILDDYAHHPTEISTTLAGFRQFYPGRRLVLDFMSHTFSRTKALLTDFGRALSGADVLILHEIYASAREVNPGDIGGESLVDAVSRWCVDAARTPEIHFTAEPRAALPLVERLVRPGDLFVTMGAGDNWQLGRELAARLHEREETS